MKPDEVIHFELPASAVQIILNAMFQRPYGEVAEAVTLVNAFIQKHKMVNEQKSD